MNVVSIMAHQDDEMRCLGTMLKCQARGDKLFFVTVTDGAGGIFQTPPLSREQGAAIRDLEMTALAGAIGAEYINLREHDEWLYDTPEVRRKIMEVMRRTGADLIFTHYFEDYNLDHTTAAQLVRHCAMHACMPLIPTDSPPLKRPPAIFMVEPHGPITFPASHYVDVSEYHQRKVELLAHHVSQEKAMRIAVNAGFDRLCTRLSAMRGEQVGCEFAECFIPMPARGAVKPYSVLP